MKLHGIQGLLTLLMMRGLIIGRVVNPVMTSGRAGKIKMEKETEIDMDTGFYLNRCFPFSFPEF